MDGRVKLGDFGLTMSMKQEVAISPVGTVEYMAPEVSTIGISEQKARCPKRHPARNRCPGTHIHGSEASTSGPAPASQRHRGSAE